MLYAIFGIPLTLYTLTNLGFIMATAFRFLYKYICCGLCCLCCSDNSADAGATTAATDGSADDGIAAPSGPARRAVSLLRGRRRRHRHVDVTESGTLTDAVGDDDNKMGWRHRLDAVFAETVDINQVVYRFTLHCARIRNVVTIVIV